MEPLKLAALDTDDLKVLSAHVQDAVMRAADMAYRPRESRFAMIVNRFDWPGALNAAQGETRYERRRTALRFDRVLSAKLQNLDPDAGDAVLELLAVQFDDEGAEPPEGFVTLVFAGGSAIHLHVECIEAELKDLGPVWRTRNLPGHDTSQVDEPAGKPDGEKRTPPVDSEY